MKNLVKLTRCLSTILVKKMDAVGVVGAGQMGTGIALVAAKDADMKVMCYDVDWVRTECHWLVVRTRSFDVTE